MIRKLLPFILLLAACKKSANDNGSAANYSEISYDGTTQLSIFSHYTGRAAFCGSKIVLAGGSSRSSASFPDSVYIYDVNTGEWSNATMGAPHATFAGPAAASGSKIVIAGGLPADGQFSDEMDIYDTRSGRWTTAKMPTAVQYSAAVGVGNLVLFAGGNDAMGFHPTVDVYNVSTGQWLPPGNLVAPGLMAGTSLGKYALFYGASGSPYEHLTVQWYVGGNGD